MKRFFQLITISIIIYSCSSEVKKTTLFIEVSNDRSNIHFSNNIIEDPTANAFYYEYIYNGGGVGVGDVNNDGLEDIYFTSNFESNKLYLNKGDLEFEDITEKSNSSGNHGWTTGISMVDINNDGLLDLYVCKSGPLPPQHRKNELLINQGLDKNGVPAFIDEASKYGLANDNFSIQAAFFDYDRDGDLDMYLMNHNGNKLSKEVLAKGSEEKSTLGDKFFVREGDKYIDRTDQVGIYSNAISFGLGIGISDLNNDGWPDIYISNDYEERDYMYINQQDGTFKEVGKMATNHMSNFSMGNDIADYDNDGFADIVVLDMVAEDNYGIKTSMPGMSVDKFNKSVEAGRHHQYMFNTLQRNSTYIDKDGLPHFSELGQMAGISNTDWSWAPLLADFDNDGYKDLFITNGIKRDFRNKDFIHTIKDYMKANRDAFVNPKKIMDLVNQTPSRPKANYIYKNDGNLGFDNYSDFWIDQNKPGYSNGATYADLDNDGDLDLIINNVDTEATLLENTASSLPNIYYIRLNFNGPKGNSKGIGTKAILYSDSVKQVYENYPVRGYQSSKPSTIHIGLGNSNSIDSIKIIWPDGMFQVLVNVPSNQTLYIDYLNSIEEEKSINNQNFNFTESWLVDAIRHQENDYDDYLKQVLLPHKLSQFGPAVAVGDVNNDGLEDIFIGNATSFNSAIYTRTVKGVFRIHQSFKEDQYFEDSDATFLDFDQDGDLDLYVVSGGNEFEPNSKNYKDRLYENLNGKFVSSPHLLPNIAISGSVVRVADYNNDGYPDVFVGGRHTPHNYPMPVSSTILMNNKGQFEDVTESLAPALIDLGMVTDASWADSDNDGDLDLLLVGEWMAPTLLINNKGNFELSNSFPEFLEGWYFSVKSVDIDNDGDLDYLLGNLGVNYKYKASKEEPFELYYADFDNNGSKDIVLGYYNFGELYPLRGKDCSSEQVPTLNSQIETYDLFGSSTLEEVYSEKALQSALVLKSHNFKSGILLNEGGNKFNFQPFPALAQVSSINDFVVRDLNQDGFKDVILGGNLFVSEIETPRNDAGYGLVLLNNKKGEFTPLDANETGLFIPYDVKKLREIEMDSSTYLLIGSNNIGLKCFKID